MHVKRVWKAWRSSSRSKDVLTGKRAVPAPPATSPLACNAPRLSIRRQLLHLAPFYQFSILLPISHRSPSCYQFSILLPISHRFPYCYQFPILLPISHTATNFPSFPILLPISHHSPYCYQFPTISPYCYQFPIVSHCFPYYYQFPISFHSFL